MSADLLNADITNFDISAESSVDVIRQLGQILVDNGYVKPTYTDSVVDRERSFPTGLALANAGIAIPHASPENNVLKNGIAIACLKSPIKFSSMENPDEEIPVNMVFMLALAGSTEHLDILKKLFVAFQDPDLVSSLQSCADKTKFLRLLGSKLN